VRGRLRTGGLQEGEGIPAVLREAEPPTADDIHGQVDGGFTGPLKVQDDGVLLGLIRSQILLVSGILFNDALKASLDGGGFVENDVVNHRPVPVE
jgi:hypothetical protein